MKNKFEMETPNSVSKEQWRPRNNFSLFITTHKCSSNEARICIVKNEVVIIVSTKVEFSKFP